MDYKANQKKANRILYMTVVIILCVMAIIVGVTSAVQRRQKPPVTDLTSPVETTRRQETEPLDIEETEPVIADTDEPVDVTEKEDDKPVENKLPTFIMPVSGTISKQHSDTALVYSLTMEDYRVHMGVDISSTLGKAVLAAADGVITKVYEDPMMGTCIEISHSGDALSVYKNLAPELPEGIAEGVNVRSGQTIASVGESALIEISEEPHIHYELKIADKWVNPVDYFPASGVGASADTAYEG